MTISTNITKLAKVAALALTLAALVVPAAQADPLVDDWFRDPTGVTAGPAVTYGPRDRLVDDWFRDPQAAAPKAAAAATDRLVDDYFRDPVPIVASQSTSSGFDWSAFGIGAAAMLGLTLLAASLVLGALAMRHRSGQLKTS